MVRFFVTLSPTVHKLTSDFAIAKHVVDAHTQINLLLSHSLSRRVDQSRTSLSGTATKDWGCSYRIVNGRSACNSHHVREDVMEKTYTAAVRQMADNAAEVIEAVREGT